MTNLIRGLLLGPGKYPKPLEFRPLPSAVGKTLRGEFDMVYPFGDDLCLLQRTNAEELGLAPNRALRKPDYMKEMTYGELVSAFRQHESKGGNDHLVGHIVFSQDSFSQPYSEAARTYVISSDNKAFIPGMGGYSIYGSSLDNSDPCVRLERYMAAEKGGADGWKVERCYLVEPGKEILSVIYGPVIICDGHDGRMHGLSETAMHMLRDKYYYPEHISKKDGQVQAEPYQPKPKEHER